MLFIICKFAGYNKDTLILQNIEIKQLSFMSVTAHNLSNRCDTS